MCQCPERAPGAEPGPVRRFNPSHSSVCPDSAALDAALLLWQGCKQAPQAPALCVFAPLIWCHREQAAGSRRAGCCVPTAACPALRSLRPVPKARLKWPSAEAAVCVTAELTGLINSSQWILPLWPSQHFCLCSKPAPKPLNLSSGGIWVHPNLPAQDPAPFLSSCQHHFFSLKLSKKGWKHTEQLWSHLTPLGVSPLLALPQKLIPCACPSKEGSEDTQRDPHGIADTAPSPWARLLAAGPVSQRARAGPQPAQNKAPRLQRGEGTDSLELDFQPRAGAAGGQGLCCAVSCPCLCTALRLPHQRRSQRAKRNPLPSSLELLALPHTRFCCRLLPAKRRHKHWGLAGLKALPWRVGKRHLGLSPGLCSLLRVHCQAPQLRPWCSSHADSAALTRLGLGPAGAPWEVDGNGWSGTQSCRNPSLSCTNRSWLHLGRLLSKQPEGRDRPRGAP